ncbi:dihydrolipoamide acetyltransferase [Mycoavidus cysteinexigens]|uniref:Dihydrolipoamide acetyltransferase component of pyruvate dehydrogenase complex n=1 Tax=Mycoavidus cysteinexigens TaxID=1553431 RepID=A0A2Z6EVC4_9BURK|nr:dihydrolipoyllysine-residue acetyltransferase [Mycoavidus cysteinexigens]BBE09336.1 dihydrolipoamide acetyltransferase [Mycoavidus cysteinexigens]GAM51906.1 dihydrolipoamide acetyltransferase component of pyruvate dehydrogenase complex [bacterium endosymbiont of Mortierella elongata FMR23-6]GLR01922.1 acetyltransferase component of pyruvate dehydrogenase complex [Mycoavidus cysteinexigens]
MSQIIEIKVPDIGDYADVPVIEVLVSPGDRVEEEQSLLTLESDKATMDIPSPSAGTVKEIRVKPGERISEGTVIVLLESEAKAPPTESASSAAASAASNAQQPPAQSTVQEPTQPPVAANAPQPSAKSSPALTATHAEPSPTQAHEPNAENHTASHASPSVRQFARELGVEVRQVNGTGPKGRITQDDVRAYVKATLQSGVKASGAASGAGGALNLLPWPQVAFTKFGPLETKPLSRIKKIAGANLHRNWVMIPHVTSHEEADITELEALRVKLNQENSKTALKVTLLAFLIKASVAALKQYPSFNTSLDGDNLIYKKYYHIGFAADTPNGLVVPVIKNADQKGVLEIAQETTELAQLAREGKLKSEQMQGGCFSISSLGGIGGTYFTPIINAPEVAILGVCRSALKPVWDGQQFMPRLMLPLSLSYDHRVIDGAEAARFNAYLASILADFRRVTL